MIFENNIQAKELSREDCVLLEASSTAGEALEKFRDYEFDYGAKSIYYVFVVKDNEFKGVVSVKELLESDKDTELREILVDDIITVSPNDNLEDVARLMSKHDFQALPVTEENNFLGIVRLDEMLEVLDEAATEDIFRKAGILNMSKKEITKSDAVLNTSIFNEIKIRLPWLLFALLGGLIAAQVIEGFEAPLQATVTLAFFLPLIMDMGGNVGTQSSTIFVRGVVLGQISDKDIVSRIVKEMVSGGLIGLITGALSAIAAYIFYGMCCCH